jgi:hypothetical protein
VDSSYLAARAVRTIGGFSALALFFWLAVAAVSLAGPTSEGLAAGDVSTLGRAVPGNNWFAMGADYKRSSRFEASASGDVWEIAAYVDGGGSGVGSQQLRFALYSDDRGEPRNLLGQTEVATVTAGAAATWVKARLATPVRISAGTYHLAILSGATGRVARYSREPAASGLRSTSDAFADGASATFGSAAPDDYEIAMYAVVTPPATAPVSVSPPSVSGAAVVGGALSAGMGVWSGEPSGYAWEWRRCDAAGAGCVAVAGAGSSYLLGSVDLGATLRVAVTAFNGVGSTTALSAPSAVVQPQPQPQPQPAPGACTKTSVATSGLQTFLNSLASGDIACLGAGSYSGNVSISTPNVTLRSAPGVRAQIRGYVWIRNTANGVKLADLDLDGTYSSTSYAVMVHGDDVTLSNMDIKNLKSGYASAICVTAGYGFETTPANIAYNLTVETSRIHDCGDDSHEHALYLESTRNAHIVDNYLYDNGGEGLQLYPDAQGSVIEYNVIDGNSLDYKANIMFAGEAAGGEYRYDHASSNNTVRYNTITNAATRYNIDSYYPAAQALPTGNLVTSNCVWNAPYGNFGYDRGTGDYSQTNNKNSNPTYQDAANKDFRLQTGSPCTGWAPRTTPAS